MAIIKVSIVWVSINDLILQASDSFLQCPSAVCDHDWKPSFSTSDSCSLADVRSRNVFSQCRELQLDDNWCVSFPACVNFGREPLHTRGGPKPDPQDRPPQRGKTSSLPKPIHSICTHVRKSSKLAKSKLEL